MCSPSSESHDDLIPIREDVLDDIPARKSLPSIDSRGVTARSVHYAGRVQDLRTGIEITSIERFKPTPHYGLVFCGHGRLSFSRTSYRDADYLWPVISRQSEKS